MVPKVRVSEKSTIWISGHLSIIGHGLPVNSFEETMKDLKTLEKFDGRLPVK